MFENIAQMCIDVKTAQVYMLFSAIDFKQTPHWDTEVWRNQNTNNHLKINLAQTGFFLILANVSPTKRIYK